MDQSRILWFVMASSVMMLFAVATMLPPGDSDGAVLNQVLPIVAVADIGLSFVIPKMIPQKRQAMLVALAMCETSALLGLVLHLTTGWPNAWMLFVLAAVGMALHFPREA